MQKQKEGRDDPGLPFLPYLFQMEYFARKPHGMNIHSYQFLHIINLQGLTNRLRTYQTNCYVFRKETRQENGRCSIHHLFLSNGGSTAFGSETPYTTDPGMLSSTSVPAPSSLHTTNRPPIRLARSRMPAIPQWPASPP